MLHVMMIASVREQEAYLKVIRRARIKLVGCLKIDIAIS